MPLRRVAAICRRYVDRPIAIAWRVATPMAAALYESYATLRA